ncbi:hypothetical protein [Agrobacterium tumefaciens]|uniref:hypothetical protein n=1 Tax=Agrobacterium tumefaciens TaxID=358 RepID=UPI0015721919|nr:hypothetical protein [Agrobacterium tumefaciens]WCK05368.1 hypothetical protein G6L31_022500 [Agrobacterium tumefaciens]
MTPRIKNIVTKRPGILKTNWTDGGQSTVDLSGWIASGGELLTPLLSTDVWKTATIADYGASVEWDSQNLEIDAYHLYQIVKNQRLAEN